MNDKIELRYSFETIDQLLHVIEQDYDHVNCFENKSFIMLHKLLSTRKRNEKALGQLHRKGFLIVSLIVLAELITFSNAVTFWSNFQTWSNHKDQDRFGNEENLENQFRDFKSSVSHRGTSSIQECASKGESKSSNSLSLPPSRLYHRQPRSRTCSKAMYECCNNTCPSCFRLDTRGGYIAPEGVTSSETIINNSFIPATPFGLPLNLWKVIFQIFLTTLNVLCWLIPLRAKKISDNELGLGLANAFSGGVFLSLAFGHLIPECIHGFEGYPESLPFMIVLSGYLLIFFVEKVAFDAHGLMNNTAKDSKQSGGGGVVRNGEKSLVGGKTELASEGLSAGRSAVILLGALAVHSVLEMTALGLANTFRDSALLSLSIALHQPAESIALLVAFLKSGMPRKQITTCLTIFSAMGPLGVLIGMAVNEFAAPIIDSVMLATVAGTFVYVGATEVIPEEWEEQEHKWKKFFALMSGIISVFAITQYTMSLEARTQ